MKEEEKVKYLTIQTAFLPGTRRDVIQGLTLTSPYGSCPAVSIPELFEYDWN